MDWNSVLHLVGQVLLVLLGIIVLLCIASFYYVKDNEEAQERNLRKALSQTEFKPDQIVEDITDFYNLLERVHPEPYTYLTKTDFLKRILDLKRSAPALATRLEFFKQFAPLVSDLGDESTRLIPPQGELDYHYSIQGRFFPFTVSILDGRGYIEHNYSTEASIPAGSEILAINDVKFSVMLERLSELFSGNSPEQRHDALSGQFKEMLYLYYGMAEEYKLSLIIKGKVTELVVEGRPFKKDRNPPYSFSQLDPGNALLTLGNIDADKRYQRFLKKAFTNLRNSGTRHLIIDLRHNHSCNMDWSNRLLEFITASRFSQVKQFEMKSSPEIRNWYLHETPPWLRWLPAKRLHPMLRQLHRIPDGEALTYSPAALLPNNENIGFNGKLTILVGPGTMATARLLAALLKEKRNARWVGSLPPLDYQPYDNSVRYHLPNTGLQVIVPTAVLQPAGGMPKQPDMEVIQTPDDLAAGKDTVLQAALQ